MRVTPLHPHVGARVDGIDLRSPLTAELRAARDALALVRDLVVWDNRCTMHRGRAYDDTVYQRDMRRVTLEDSAPTLEQAL